MESAHGGGPAWAVCQRAQDEKEESNCNAAITLLSGGSDAAVHQWSFTPGPQPAPQLLTIKGGSGRLADFPKLVMSVGDQQQVVVVTQDGIIYLASCNSPEMVEVYRERNLVTYAVMSVLDGERRLLFGSLSGDVIVFDLSMAGCLEKLMERYVACGRVLAAALLTLTEFLVSDYARMLALWAITPDGRTAEKLAKVRLPEMKHAWFTVARKWGEGCYVVGDRSGGVRFYTRVEDRLEPRQEFHRIHGPNGVTDISIIR